MADFSFEAELIHWRGPAPFYFATVPKSVGEQIALRARDVSYGWGVIPVEATINEVTFRTSLFPKDGTYLLPLKAKVRDAVGDIDWSALKVTMTLG